MRAMTCARDTARDAARPRAARPTRRPPHAPRRADSPARRAVAETPNRAPTVCAERLATALTLAALQLATWRFADGALVAAGAHN